MLVPCTLFSSEGSDKRGSALKMELWKFYPRKQLRPCLMAKKESDGTNDIRLLSILYSSLSSLSEIQMSFLLCVCPKHQENDGHIL